MKTKWDNMEWLEVSDNEPPKDIPILAFWEDIGPCVAVLEYADGWDGFHWYLTCHFEDFMDDFTKWMPLPWRNDGTINS